ncbi:hypothetical protein EW146_g136 [Bondarzewia mesenterica]|uniref:Peroxin-3 n=1 Tax=Bondarzewia mesenterica TaxID=1095465 RepID=A0A4S4M850_9AGAM|nr:hypothetical protein EW146_g136 [Bondarzewia mesenterica]
MFKSLTGFVYERRRTLGVLGGAYLVGRYVLDRLEDVRERVMQERSARENVRKRFQQNMQDIGFMVMAHMPILGQHVLEEMDVEALTAELQALSRATRVPHTHLHTHQEPERAHERSQAREASSSSPVPPSESSLASSVELVRDDLVDMRSEMGSVSVLSMQDDDATRERAGDGRGEGESSSGLAESQTSWVDSISAAPHDKDGEGGSGGRPSLADSGVTTAGSSTMDLVSSQMSLSTKSKAELWREVKMLTVTRTLTVLYSTTLLSLFTHIQLSLLGRYKYVQSMIELSRDEDGEDFEASIASLFFASPGGEDVEALWSEKGGWEKEEEDAIWRDGVDEETERRYLTLSWWILNVGWKDVGERVRRGVEEVFEGVSLKNKLGIVELHRLLCDVRRRVEYEVTFEGTERRINFQSTLLPPTASALTHLLARAGFPSNELADAHTPAFTTLLEETRDILSSSNFMLVLERCLDRGTAVLLDGLQKNVFALEGNAAEHDEAVRLRLAGMLPGLARWSALALNGLPNELVDNLADVREVAGFSAIIYAGYEDRFW